MAATPAVDAAADQFKAFAAGLTPEQARDVTTQMLTQFLMTAMTGKGVPTQALAALALVALRTGERDPSSRAEFSAVWRRYVEAQVAAEVDHG